MEVAERIEKEGETPELMEKMDSSYQKLYTVAGFSASEQNEDTIKGKTFHFWHRVATGTCQFCNRENVPLEWRHTHGENTHNVSDYAFWAVNGGVEAMKEEMKKCTAVCRSCAYIHFPQEQNQPEYVNTDNMPNETPAEKLAIRQRIHNNIKYAYVARIKLDIGSCADCGMQVQEGQMRVFAFAHKDASRR